MKMLVCLLEERSAQTMLEGGLPRLFPDLIFKCIAFEGKQDLEKQLVRKLRNWKTPDTAFLVMRDQDSANCKEVKARLVSLCREAGKSETLVRIACHELESFYFGDLPAVKVALGFKCIINQSAKYRIPDNIENPSIELEKITSGAYQKIDGSRSIGKYLSLDTNTSCSFNTLLLGLKKLLAQKDL